MNRIAFTLLTLLFASAIWGQTLSTTGGTTPLSSIVGPGDTYYTSGITPGEFVPGELIVYFENPSARTMGRFQKGVTEKGWTFVASSPLNHYALIRNVSKVKPGLRVPLQPGCSLLGDGNDLLNAVGGGDGIDLNYIMGTDFVHHGGHPTVFEPCLPLGLEGDDPLIENYNANEFCSSQYELEPPSGSSSVHIGVIDGGMYMPSRVNGVDVNQVVFPLRNTPALGADDFHLHGEAIMSLISGIFLEAGAQDNLTMTSYKVMDKNLRATAFDVASAIEYAADPGTPTPQILSLSIGFIPLICGTNIRSNLAEDNILKLAIDAAQAQNIIVITSAGNDGVDLDSSPQYPAAEDELGNLVTVGALSCAGGGRSAWSNYSSTLVSLLTAGNEVNIVIDNCFQLMSGTSFSCPIVAAKAGLHVSEMATYEMPEVMCLLSSQTVPSSFARHGIVDANAYQNNCIIVDPGGGIYGPDGGIYGPDGGFNDETIQGTIRGGGITVSPNPTRNSARISFQGAVGNNTVLTVMDTGGNQVLEQTLNSNNVEIDLSGFRAGIYFASVRNSSGVTTKRIVKR